MDGHPLPTAQLYQIQRAQVLHGARGSGGHRNHVAGDIRQARFGATAWRGSAPCGRPPRKDYWDRLWAFIAAGSIAGRLVPHGQAAIEKAMLDWAAANDCALSEQSARSRARQVMAAIGKEGKN